MQIQIKHFTYTVKLTLVSQQHTVKLTLDSQQHTVTHRLQYHTTIHATVNLGQDPCLLYIDIYMFTV